MTSIFRHHFPEALSLDDIEANTGLFINGEFVDSVDKGTIEYVLCSTSEVRG